MSLFAGDMIRYIENPEDATRKLLCLVSCVQLFVTPWTAAHQTPLSMGILQARMLEYVATSSGGSSDLGIKPRSLALQTDSLPSEPPGKPRNTEVGSLSLFQGIFLTQELNQGRQILYQQS